MPILVDTNIAVHVRDRDPTIVRRLASLSIKPFISIVTRVELEGGVYARRDLIESRREGLVALLAALPVLDFNTLAAEAYHRIAANTGYSRAKILDRMIAATAIAHDLTLATINGDDFRDIPDLALEVWPSPAAQ